MLGVRRLADSSSALWLTLGISATVEKPREHAADAELLCQVTEATVDQAKKLMRGKQVRPGLGGVSCSI